jgi:hypothetical protein
MLTATDGPLFCSKGAAFGGGGVHGLADAARLFETCYVPGALSMAIVLSHSPSQTSFVPS